MKHIAGLLLLCLMIPAAPAAEPPHRASRNLDVPEPGWVRVLLDPATRGRMMPRANDLRVLDPVGREVPYALIESTAEETWGELRVMEVFKTGDGWRILLDAGSEAPLHDSLRFDFPEEALASRCALEGSDDRESWRLLARGSLFRLGASEALARTALSYAPSGERYLRLSWPREAGYPEVRRIQVRLHRGETGDGSSVRPEARLESREPGGAIYRVPLSGRGLLVDEISFSWSGSGSVGYRFLRPGEGRWSLFSEGTLSRPLGGEAVRTVPFDGRIAGDESVLLELHGGGEAEIGLEEIRVAFRPQWIIFHAREAGTYLMVYGGYGLGDPRYTVKPPVSPETLPQIRPGEEMPAAAIEDADVLPRKGGRFPETDFRYRAAVDPGTVPPAGVARLVIPEEVYEGARRDLGDLRLKSGEHQVPYVRWQPPDPVLAVDRPAVAPERGEGTLSTLEIPLEHSELPYTALELTAPAAPFRRPVAVYLVAERGPGLDPALSTVGTGTWTCGGIAALPCLMEFRWPRGLSARVPPRPGTDPAKPSARLRIRFEDGDNPPLASVSVRLWRRTDVLVFRPPDGELSLRWGAASLGAPRYDAALTRDQLLSLPCSEATTAAPAAAGKAPAWGTKALVGVLILAGLLMLVILARVMKSGGGAASAKG